jgi:hypothetical protein
MNQSSVLLSVALVGMAALGAASPRNRITDREKEINRLEKHFDSVDVELRSRDVSMLSASQRSNRVKLITWLRDYRNADEFPTNDRFANPTPFFRDSKGVLCAMAYLIDRSGSHEFVNKVAATRNNAYIHELADDRVLIRWLDKWGLSVDEAARIQPSYGGGGIGDVDGRVEDDFAIAAIALGSASVGSAAINFVKPSYFSGFAGILAGGAAIVVGANNFDENRATDHVAALTIGLGAFSVGAGIYGLLEARNRDHDRGRWPYDRRDRRRGHEVKLVPDLAIQNGTPKLGVFVNSRF